MLSTAVAVPISTAVVTPVASTATSAGAVTTGATVSTITASVTVTVCVASPVLPASSVALHVTIVVPTGYGPVLSAVAVNTPSMLSTAVAVPISTAVVTPVDSTVTLAGAVTTGATVSTITTSVTVTVTVAVSEPPLPSDNVYTKLSVPDTPLSGVYLMALLLKTSANPLLGSVVITTCNSSPVS